MSAQPDHELPDGFWWRAEVVNFGNFDEYGDFLGSYSRVQWKKFLVTKVTPKGVWLVPAYGLADPNFYLDHPDPVDHRNFLVKPTFVVGKAKRQLACPTRATALRDAMARKVRHISGCMARLHNAERGMDHLRMEARKLGLETPDQLTEVLA